MLSGHVSSILIDEWYVFGLGIEESVKVKMIRISRFCFMLIWLQISKLHQ